MSILRVNSKLNFLFILTTISAFSLPYARIVLGGIPLYTLTLSTLLIGLYASYLYSKNGISVKVYFFQFFIIFILLTIFHIQYVGTFLTLFTGINRFISFFFFFSIFYLNYLNIVNKDYLLKIIAIGFKFHIILILLHYISGQIGGSVLDYYYTFIYKIISQSDKFYEHVDIFEKSWYLIRYYGGYHNPNPAGVSLVLAYIILKISNFKIKLFWIYLFFFCLFLTASKQSIVLLFVFLFIKNFKRLSIYFVGLIIIIFTLSYLKLGDLLDRVSNSEDYLQSAGERFWGYINFYEFIYVNPLGFIFGTGINSISLRSSVININSLDVGFVSNSFFLLFSFIGLVGFVFLGIIFSSLYRLTKNKKMFIFFVLLVFLVALFDNHIAIMESMQIIIFLGIITIANIKRKI